MTFDMCCEYTRFSHRQLKYYILHAGFPGYYKLLDYTPDSPELVNLRRFKSKRMFFKSSEVDEWFKTPATAPEGNIGNFDAEYLLGAMSDEVEKDWRKWKRYDNLLEEALHNDKDETSYTEEVQRKTEEERLLEKYLK